MSHEAYNPDSVIGFTESAWYDCLIALRQHSIKSSRTTDYVRPLHLPADWEGVKP